MMRLHVVHERAEALIERCIMQKTDAVCIREVQKSLAQSVKKLLEVKIEAMRRYIEAVESDTPFDPTDALGARPAQDQTRGQEQNPERPDPDRR